MKEFKSSLELVKTFIAILFTFPPGNIALINVTVFTEKHFKGGRLSFMLNGTSDSECMSPLPPLVDMTISSINTGGGCVSLYKAQNCVGDFVSLKPGNPVHQDLSYWEGYNDAVRSIGPCLDPCHPRMIEKRGKGGNYVSLFEHPYYKGYHVTLDLKPKECVQLSVKMKRRISSIKTHGKFCIELHHNWDCSGKFIDVRPGSPLLYYLLYWWGHDDTASAVSLCGYNCTKPNIRVPTDKNEKPDKNSVILYDEINMQGNKVSINLNLTNVDVCVNITDEWDGQTQSIKLPENSSIIVFEEFGCSSTFGWNLTLDQDNRNIAKNLQLAQFDRVIQSLRICHNHVSAIPVSNGLEKKKAVVDEKWPFLAILFLFILIVLCSSVVLIGGIMIVRRLRDGNANLGFFKRSGSLRELIL